MGKERIGLDTITSGRFAGRPIRRSEPSADQRPNRRFPRAEPAAAAPDNAEPTPEDAKKYLEGTRWLYDDEADYKRAQKKLATEIAREKIKKDLAKKARIEKVKSLSVAAKSTAKKHAKRALPLARRALAKAKRTERKKLLLIGGAMTAALLMFVVVPQLNKGKKTPSQVLAGHTATPTFNTILPNDNISQTTSGKIAFNTQRGVASYTDAINDVAITVSQQALPERFQKDPLGQLGKFAEDINAKDKMELDGATAYSGLSAKGPQTTVLIKNDLLVFITAEKKLDNDALRDYINSLK